MRACLCNHVLSMNLCLCCSDGWISLTCNLDYFFSGKMTSLVKAVFTILAVLRSWKKLCWKLMIALINSSSRRNVFIFITPLVHSGLGHKYYLPTGQRAPCTSEAQIWTLFSEWDQWAKTEKRNVFHHGLLYCVVTVNNDLTRESTLMLMALWDSDTVELWAKSQTQSHPRVVRGTQKLLSSAPSAMAVQSIVVQTCLSKLDMSTSGQY